MRTPPTGSVVEPRPKERSRIIALCTAYVRRRDAKTCTVDGPIDQGGAVNHGHLRIEAVPRELI
jgi:hypothetical protein